MFPLEIFSKVFHFINDRNSQRHFLSMCKLLSMMIPETYYFNLKNRDILIAKSEILLYNISRIIVLSLHIELLKDLRESFGITLFNFTNLQELKIINSSLKVLGEKILIKSMNLQRLHILSKCPLMLKLDIKDSKIDNMLLENISCKGLFYGSSIREAKLIDSMIIPIAYLESLEIKSLEIRSSHEIFQNKENFLEKDYMTLQTRLKIMFNKTGVIQKIPVFSQMVKLLNACNRFALEELYFQGFITRKDRMLAVQRFENLRTLQICLSSYEKTQEGFFMLRIIVNNMDEIILFY